MSDREKLQIQLEELFSKNQTIPRIRKEFEECKAIDFKEFFITNKIDPKFGFDLLVQMALHKRCDLPTLVGVMRGHFQSAQECVDAIQKAAALNLIDWAPPIKMFVVKAALTVSQDVQDEIDRFQFPLPMVVPPIKLERNMQSAYYLGKSSVILKNNHHNDDVCLDHLNRCNAVKYKINFETVSMVSNEWKSLDKLKEGETREDLERRRRAFAKYDRTAKDVMSLLVQQGNELYLTHKYDKRGRTYCQGYHVNTQGTAWNKAAVEFFNEELTT